MSCYQFADFGSSLCAQFPGLEDSQSAMLLLRHCYVSGVKDLVRTVLPQLLQQACEVCDFLTRSSFQDIIGSVTISNLKWYQATLSMSCGGFGLSASPKILHLAFVSSWAHSLRDLPKRFHDLEESVNNLLLDADSMGPIGHKCSSNGAGEAVTVSTINDNVKLQQRLTQQNLKADFDYLLNN